MLGENFVYFFTVQGFFVGIIFGILKSFNAEGLLTYTFVFTMFFYLFSHIIVAFYFKTITAAGYFFPKDPHEKELDLFLKEIKKREKIVDSTCQILDLPPIENHENKKLAKS